jgi:hypothetical protein
MTPWWGLVLTFVGGVVATLGVEFLRTINAREDRRLESQERRADRESEQQARAENREEEKQARIEERSTLRLEAHWERQRVALTELQDRLSDYLRKTGRAHMQDVVAWKQAGEPDEFPVGLVDAELDKSLNDDHRRVLILAERVHSETIRNGTLTLVRHCAAVLNEHISYEQARRSLAAAAETFETVNAEIGRALRKVPD